MLMSLASTNIVSLSIKILINLVGKINRTYDVYNGRYSQLEKCKNIMSSYP